MAGSQHLNLKESRSKRILAIALLLSLSVFTGYTGKQTTRYRQPVQTAWQYSNHQRAAKCIVSHKKTAAALYASGAVSNANRYVAALLAYNKIIKVQLLHAGRIAGSIKTATRFIYRKPVPKSEDQTISIPVTV